MGAGSNPDEALLLSINKQLIAVVFELTPEEEVIASKYSPFTTRPRVKMDCDGIRTRDPSKEKNKNLQLLNHSATQNKGKWCDSKK